MKVPNFIQYGVQNLSLRNRKKKERKGIQEGKEEIK